ncbi:hypothetical protein F511_28132 [Dorcoceras hygrometricum]|uniref:Uncharacterized protein n=1 Tax=Dorcoceras hygrometricum TaxID=472368 RepID=A0A2Z7BBC8_9LAMI|nr:hypothetical protein F511_28132 [Dorcoceras hygrometricum]
MHCSLRLVDQLVKIYLQLVVQTLVVKCLRLDYPTTAPSSPDFHVVGLVSITSMRRFCSCQNSSALLVQTDGGLVFPVVDLIKEYLPPPTLEEPDFL